MPPPLLFFFAASFFKNSVSTLYPLNSLSNSNIKYLVIHWLSKMVHWNSCNAKNLRKLAKTGDVSASYISLRVLVVFHLLNAKAEGMSETTQV